MKPSPTISVVMAVYNGEKYLDEAVQSICRQTFGDFEFIIVDDGSTDRTAEILQRHAAKDGRIRVLPQPKQGCVASLNYGLATARGEFIARMDADDVSLPDRFEKQINYLRAYPAIAVLGGAAQYFEDAGLLDMFMRPPLQHQEILNVLSHCNPMVHDAMLIRRAALEAVGGYRPAFVAAEDLDLWLRLAEHYELANLEDVVIHLRKHPAEVSFMRAAQQSLSALAAKYAGKSRQRLGRDPFDGVSMISPKILVEAGVPPAQIEATLLEGPRHRTNVLLHCGEGETARQILDDADRFLSELPSSRWARSRIALLRSKSYRIEHKMLKCLQWAAWAYLLDPLRILDKVDDMVRHLRQRNPGN